MALINHESKELHCKIVYYGPSLGGKTTNVKWVYDQIAGPGKSKLEEFDFDPERTLTFDFLPVSAGKWRGLSVRFHLYSVPGQEAMDHRRKLLLTNVDGVVFVADSQLDRMEENIQSLKNLERNLEQHGYDLQKMPLVIQYNKRDLPGVASVAELRAALNRFNAPDYEAKAQVGEGVMESFKTLSKSLIAKLKGGQA